MTSITKLTRPRLCTIVLFFSILGTPLAQTRIKDLAVPDGFKRNSCADTSFSGWIQSLKLKPDKTIREYDGSYVPEGYYNQLAVIDMPLLFKADLEQCADFCMRLWAEYHKSRNSLDRLYLFDYGGNKRLLSKSGKTYMAFLKSAFANTNSFSLKKGCLAVVEDSLRPGDMFIQNGNGGVGHASMIVDMCTSYSGGRRLYLVGFGFMPAQEFHIEGAASAYGVDGWFTFDGAMRYLQETFYLTPVLRRF
jgi:hypothetical protein